MATERKSFQLTSKYITTSAKAQGFSLEHALTEFIDNSYGNGATKVEVIMTPQKRNGYTFKIVDNGNGMSPEVLTKAITHIGYDDQYDKNSVSVYGAGMKFGMFAMCDEGNVTVETVKDGIKSIATFSTSPSKAGFVDITEGNKTRNPNGTSITITNVQIKQIELEHIYKNMAVRYFPALEVIPGVELHLPNYKDMGQTTSKIQFEDPLYRHLTDDDATYVNIIPEEFMIDDDVIPVTRYSLVKDNIASHENGFINWDSKLEFAKHSKAGFTMNRSGVFIKIGFRYATIGDADFIFCSPQMNYNNLRIEMEIPVHHADKFLQINKSKTQLKKTGMDKLQYIIKDMTSDHQSTRCPGSALDSEELKTLENLNNLINNDVKRVHNKNLLDITDIANSIPEEPIQLRKEHQGGTKHQPSFKKSNDWLELRYEDADKSLPHYRATRLNKKLIIHLNNNHPYIYNYLRKLPDIQAQKAEGIKLYSNYVGLSKTRMFEQFPTEAMESVIQNEGDELRKFFIEED